MTGKRNYAIKQRPANERNICKSEAVPLVAGQIECPAPGERLLEVGVHPIAARKISCKNDQQRVVDRVDLVASLKVLQTYPQINSVKLAKESNR